MTQFPQAVTIAGHDSDGSAGMPADLHTFFADGVYGHGLLTAAVAGNSYHITQAHVMPADFITEQFKVLAADFDIKAAKTGMLATKEVIAAVAAGLKAVDFGAVVVDPVIITKHGNTLLEPEAEAAFKRQIIPLADVITPNFYEAQHLTQIELSDDAAFAKAAQQFKEWGAKNVVIKGKHTSGQTEPVRDYVLLASGEHFWMEEDYVATDRVNGTGDSFSALIAAELAKGNPLKEALNKAKKFVHAAIAQPIEVGHKFGPINHWAGATVLPTTKKQ